MKIKIFICIVSLIALVGNRGVEVKEGQIYVRKIITENIKRMIGIPYEAKIDEKARKTIEFLRNHDKSIGKVMRYRRKMVNGFNHYFEFEELKFDVSKKHVLGRKKLEIVVYETFGREYKIISKNYL